MSLRKSPTLTPARLAANRRNARKSTGPRTARGKGWSRLNSLRSGARSSLYHGLWRAMCDAPPCQMASTARATLTPQLASHPLFAEAVDMFVKAEIAVVEESRWHREATESRRRKRC
ncbi:MAG: hypothetical protein ABSF14_11240 [Terriglobia bacterium]|jgi:hypothetical protein